jgi:hypothetical protein
VTDADGNSIVVNAEDRAIDKSYYYFQESALHEEGNSENEYISGPDEFKPEVITKELTYTTFVPKYNVGAEKVRSITAKESNYFNIL